MTATIHYRSDSHPTIAFAAGELKRYLERITGTALDPRPVQTPVGQGSGGLRLGLFEDFPDLQSEGRPTRRAVPAVPDDGRLDDAFVIETCGADGTIAGRNPRSVLLAVYRYLHALGCRWIRPGAKGEILPPVNLERSVVSLREVAAFRHRGVDLAGAISAEHLCEFIDWAPKLGFNSYFLELDDCSAQCGLWYRHASHPSRKPEAFSDADAAAIRARMLAEIRKRDGLYHGMGHGWPLKCLGLPVHGWDDVAKAPPPPEAVPWLAEVNGRREYYQGKPLFTNLCYSHPEVRQAFVSCVADYAQTHPEIDYLHVWLADQQHNFCECAGCRVRRPADQYLDLLNAVDVELTRRRLPTRIVFLAYLDLLWPPCEVRLANPDRFVFMFAPISRSYDAAYSRAVSASRSATIPPYEYNRSELPATVAGNLAFLWPWQEWAACDSFCFDYHYYFGLPNDLAGLGLARVLHDDIGGLPDMGLNGLVSCQTLRAVLPTGFGMTVMGRMLWEGACDLDAVLDDHFQAAFGEDGKVCLAVLERVSSALARAEVHRPKPLIDAGVAGELDRIGGVLDTLEPVIRRHVTQAGGPRAHSWNCLEWHVRILRGLGLTLAARARGDAAATMRHLDDTVRLIWECEEWDSSLLDGWLMRLMLRSRLKPAQT